MQAARSSSQQWPPAAMQQRPWDIPVGKATETCLVVQACNSGHDRINQQRGSPQRDPVSSQTYCEIHLTAFSCFSYYLLNIY